MIGENYKKNLNKDHKRKRHHKIIYYKEHKIQLPYKLIVNL